MVDTHPVMVLRGLFSSQLEKATDMPLPAWAWSVAFGALQVVVNDAFFWLWIILLVVNTVDWIAGRWTARTRGEFSTTRSREGLYSKALGLVVVAALRSLEAVLPRAVAALDISTYGAIASTVTVLLILEDLGSIDIHRQALGKSPIPLLSAFIRRLQTVTGGERRTKGRDSGGGA